MGKIKFFSIWLLLIVSTLTVVFNSCNKDNDLIAVTGISLDKPTLTLSVGAEQTLKATIIPDNAKDKAITWLSSDTNVVTVSRKGLVTAITIGTSTITAQVDDQSAQCTVIVKFGVVINGVTWAPCNVDAPGIFSVRPENTGMFYQWNRKTAWSVGSITDDWDTSTPIGTRWEKENDPSPAGWRVPTSEELYSLFDAKNVTNMWVTVNGVTGRKFTDKATGNNIFLPAAGELVSFIDNGALYYAGLNGTYWSSTPNGSEHVYALAFGVNGTERYDCLRWDLLSIRCVAE